MHTVSAKHVQAAARDSEFVVGWQRYRRTFGIACVLVIILLAILYLPGQHLLQSGITPVINEVAPAKPPEIPAKDNNSPAVDVTDKGMATIYQPQDSSNYYDYFSAGQIEITTDKTRRQAQIPAVESRDENAGKDDIVENISPKQADGSDVNAEPVLSGDAQLLQILEKTAPDLPPAAIRAMAEQLRQLPPETGVTQGDNSCNLCSSFIYRPLKKNEYL